MEKPHWLLLLSQLPASPSSSLRVLIWRRLRAAGATSLQNGVWALPDNSQSQKLVQDLLSEISPQNETGMVLISEPLDPSLNEKIIESFRTDRDQEYTEFIGKCRDFLQEIEKETALSNFNFAELEENEQDLHKLTNWLEKIQARDFFEGHNYQKAVKALEECQVALNDFTRQVYHREGLINAENDQKDPNNAEQKTPDKI